MKLWPSESFVVETSMSPERVYAAFAEATEPLRFMRSVDWFATRDPKILFQGTVTPQRFDIRRIISYRNSFLPHATGMIQPCAIGSRVSIELRLHPLTLAIIAIWLGVVALAGVSIGLLIGAVALQPQVLIPFGMLVFGSFMTGGGFWLEVPKTKRLLIAILDGALPTAPVPPRTF
jgi:hypothetical protein